MIKTTIGDTIDLEILNQKIQDVIDEIMVEDYQINCFPEDNRLVIVISEYHPQVIDRVQEIIEEYQVDFIIRDGKDINNIYVQKNREISDSIIEKKSYRLANFSVGFIVSILGLFSLIGIGIFYYFSRPCVWGNCTLIVETKKTIDESFNPENIKELKQEDIIKLQENLIVGISELKRIPSWSKSYEEANNLVKKYENEVKQLENLLTALKLEKDGLSLMNNLPLSLEEWNRVKGFWQDALNNIKALNIEDLSTLKQEKIEFFNQQISLVELKIIKEQKWEKKLAEIKQKATELEGKKSQVINLKDLENIEKNWQNLLSEVNSIEPQTMAYQQKEELLNSYLKNLTDIKGKITQEKSALNLKKEAENNIQNALVSQNKNQWSKAVSFWENAMNILKKIPPETLLTKEIKDLETNTTKELEKAKSELKKAIVKEEIRGELKKICEQSDLKCSYSVDNNIAKIFLSQEYLQKIASLSNLQNLTNNAEQEKLINTHISQVEKNYQYLSNKYRIFVEIYNPQRQLIMLYNPSTITSTP